MKKVEFIGSSAVGKSTLLVSVLEKRSIEDKWFTHKEVKKELVNKLKHNIFTDRKKYYLPYLSNFSTLAYNHLQKSLVNKYKDDIFDFVVPDYVGLLEILIESLANSNELEAHKKIQIMNYYFQILLEDVGLLEYLGFEGTVVYDECLIQNNVGCADQHLYEQMLKMHSDNRYKMNPDGIIFCSINPQDNLKRRKKRFEDGTIRFFEKNLSEDELLRMCTRDCLLAERKARVMRNLGVPVLEIDMSKSNEENVPLILSFISKIDQQESVLHK